MRKVEKIVEMADDPQSKWVANIGPQLPKPPPSIPWPSEDLPQVVAGLEPPPQLLRCLRDRCCSRQAVVKRRATRYYAAIGSVPPIKKLYNV